MEISAFQISDTITFFILQLGYRMQVRRHFKGFTGQPMHRKNCIDWSKIRCLRKATMDGKAEMGVKTKIIG